MKRFDSQESEFVEHVVQVLTTMLQTLVPYSAKYNFAVEGHTDSTPIVPGGPFATNWELASERAIVVRQRLEELGIDRAHMRVEAYADTKPLTSADLAGLAPQDRAARHRRVVVRMY